MLDFVIKLTCFLQGRNEITPESIKNVFKLTL